MSSKSMIAEVPPMPCPKCDKVFDHKNHERNRKALQMHDDRAHTGKIITPGQKKASKFSKEQLENKRIYNARIRAANRAKGLTSAGLKRKRPLRAIPKPKSGWTTEQRKKHKATWEAKKNGSKGVLEMSNAIMEEVNEERLEDPRGYINNCPHCGGKLQAFFLAAGAMKRHGQ